MRCKIFMTISQCIHLSKYSSVFITWLSIVSYIAHQEKITCKRKTQKNKKIIYLEYDEPKWEVFAWSLDIHCMKKDLSIQKTNTKTFSSGIIIYCENNLQKCERSITWTWIETAKIHVPVIFLHANKNLKEKQI